MCRTPRFVGAAGQGGWDVCQTLHLPGLICFFMAGQGQSWETLPLGRPFLDSSVLFCSLPSASPRLWNHPFQSEKLCF